MAHSIPDEAADFQTKFLFRLHLLREAKRIDYQSNGLENAKFLLKSHFTREEELRIESGVELFACLEQAGEISTSNTAFVKDVMSVCDLEYKPFVKYDIPPDVSPRRCEFNARLNHVGLPERDQENMYNACLIGISKKLAKADKSLQELVYLCPEVGLGDMGRFRTGCELFTALEAKQLISPTQLSYLYCRLRCLMRDDLAEKITVYMHSCRERTLLRMRSDPGVHERSEASQDLKSQSSLDTITSANRKVSQPGKVLSDGGTAAPLWRRDTVQDACSVAQDARSVAQDVHSVAVGDAHDPVTETMPLHQAGVPVANGVSSGAARSHQGEVPAECRSRSPKAAEPRPDPESEPRLDPKSEPRPDPKSKPRPDPKSELRSIPKSELRSSSWPSSSRSQSQRRAEEEASVSRELGNELQQDDTAVMEMHHRHRTDFLKQVYSLPAVFFELFKLLLCIVFKRTGEVSDHAITIFNHPVYRMMYCLQQTTLKTMLGFVLSMVVLANLYKFLLEEDSCGLPNAVLNFFSRLFTHTVLPAYYLNHLWGIDNSSLESLKFLAVVAKRDRYSHILKKVITELSTSSEISEFGNKTAIEQVNIILDTKLSVVCRTSLLLSVVFFLQIFLLGASNFNTFEASPSALSLLCIIVITVASFVVHCVSGVICCLYLFEMRVREYCAHIHRAVRKSGTCDRELRQDIKAVRSTLNQRWKYFKWVVLLSSVVYLAILCVSMATGTPFHCHGESVKFAESEINQIRAAWAFNIILGLLCHCLVYSYFNFLTGRSLAVCLQAIFLFVSLVDSNGPKWAIVFQISNVVYPAASSLSLHLLACHAIFNKEGGSNVDKSLFWIFFFKLRTSCAFLTHFGLLVIHVVAILLAVHHEYASFAPLPSEQT